MFGVWVFSVENELFRDVFLLRRPHSSQICDETEVKDGSRVTRNGPASWPQAG
jgi:hypothetical protein